MLKGCLISALVLVVAGVGCGETDADTSPASRRPDTTEDAAAVTSTTSLPVTTVAATGPVAISATPPTVLSGGTITVSYSATSDGSPISGRWQREAWASWAACADTECTQVAWLRLGAQPVRFPGSPLDRSHLPYDHLERENPDGPDRFEIPADADGSYRVCSTLRSVPDATEAIACAPVTVLGVPSAVLPGESPGWFEIDPSNPPTSNSTTLHVLVHTVLCERPTKVGQPEVVYADSEIAVLTRAGRVDCGGATPPGGPTPATVTLPGPLGNRAVLDAVCLDPLPYNTPCQNAPRGQRWPLP